MPGALRSRREPRPDLPPRQAHAPPWAYLLALAGLLALALETIDAASDRKGP